MESPSPVRVLVVDDEPTLRRLLTRALEGAGFRAESASNGDEALSLLGAAGTCTFRVVLIDLDLPPRGGADLFRRLRSAHPATGVILTSGSAPPAALVRELEEARGVFLAKPFSPSTLVREIGKLAGVDPLAAGGG